MRRGLLGVIVMLAALAALSTGALGRGVRVRVSPGTGGIHAHFTLRFTIPDATGPTGAVTVSDAVSILGDRHRGCVGAAEIPLRRAAAGTAFTVSLNLDHRAGHWCPGRFHGMLLERRSLFCAGPPVAIVCPQIAFAPRVLGRFSFVVTAPST